VGTSRKTFLGRIAPLADGTPTPPDDRLEATVATSAWAVVHGADVIRVHDVTPAVQTARLWGSGAPDPAPEERPSTGSPKEPTP
jgi:dihydropteroate synthase